MRKHVAGQPPLRLYAGSAHEFFARAVNATLVFGRGEDGAIAGLTLKQEGHTFEARLSA